MHVPWLLTFGAAPRTSQGPPFRSALKVLAQRFLKRRIQEGSHDSVIDARTALDLVHLKVKHGARRGRQT